MTLSFPLRSSVSFNLAYSFQNASKSNEFFVSWSFPVCLHILHISSIIPVLFSLPTCTLMASISHKRKWKSSWITVILLKAFCHGFRVIVLISIPISSSCHFSPFFVSFFLFVSFILSHSLHLPCALFLDEVNSGLHQKLYQTSSNEMHPFKYDWEAVCVKAFNAIYSS